LFTSMVPADDEKAMDIDPGLHDIKFKSEYRIREPRQQKKPKAKVTHKKPKAKVMQKKPKAKVTQKKPKTKVMQKNKKKKASRSRAGQ
jgi:hypothetical protein